MGLKVSLPDAFRMGAQTPARLIGVDGHKGSLEPWKDADLIVIDDQIQIHTVMIKGNWVSLEEPRLEKDSPHD